MSDDLRRRDINSLKLCEHKTASQANTVILIKFQRADNAENIVSYQYKQFIPLIFALEIEQSDRSKRLKRVHFGSYQAVLRMMLFWKPLIIYLDNDLKSLLLSV